MRKGGAARAEKPGPASRIRPRPDTTPSAPGAGYGRAGQRLADRVGRCGRCRLDRHVRPDQATAKCHRLPRHRNDAPARHQGQEPNVHRCLSGRVVHGCAASERDAGASFRLSNLAGPPGSHGCRDADPGFAKRHRQHRHDPLRTRQCAEPPLDVLGRVDGRADEANGGTARSDVHVRDISEIRRLRARTARRAAHRFEVR